MIINLPNLNSDESDNQVNDMSPEERVQESIILEDSFENCDDAFHRYEQLQDIRDNLTGVIELLRSGDINDEVLEFINGQNDQICRVCGWDSLPSADSFPTDEAVSHMEETLRQVDVEMEAFGLKWIKNLFEGFKRYARKGDPLGKHADRLKKKGKGKGFDAKVKDMAGSLVKEGMPKVADQYLAAAKDFANVLKALDKLSAKEKIEQKDVKPIRKKAADVANKLTGVEIDESKINKSKTPDQERLIESTPKDAGVDNLDDAVKMLETLVDCAVEIFEFTRQTKDERTFNRVMDRANSDETREMIMDVLRIMYAVIHRSTNKVLGDARKIATVLS